MFTTGRRSFLFNFFSLLSILLLHLGCFTFSSRHRRRDSSSTSTSSLFKKKLIRPPKPGLVSFLRRLFSPSLSSSDNPTHPPTSIPSPSSSTRSLRPNPPPTTTTTHQSDTTTTHAKNGADDQINPCSVCGEIFHSATLLKHHQSTNHAVSDLVDGENIVRIIFKTGWPDKAKRPTIHRILKIHSSPRILTRFEDHREFVKSRAAAKTIKTTTPTFPRDERCIADGNELLRFHCTTFICGLDSTICSHQYCSACGIIRTGFSHKMDGISTMPTSWKAHAAVPDDLEEEFSFMHVKRALLVCRVVAGRVGCDPGLADKTDPGFDSLVGQEDDELLVFNPKAVLPCFVIVYTV
ncbi:hypothetical protein ACP275_11G058300 [Erythranthe tilingii]